MSDQKTTDAPLSSTDAEWEREHPHGIRCRYTWPDGFRCEGEISEVQEFKPSRAWRHVRGKWHAIQVATPYFKCLCSRHGWHDGPGGTDEDGTVFELEKLPAVFRDALRQMVGQGRS